ncbi:MAG: M56 family metallopeptidase [Rudaea sp.]
MIAFADLIPWIDALGRGLLHFVWQGAIIGLLYVMLRPFCTSVAGRYRLGMAALLLMVATLFTTLAWMHPGPVQIDATAFASTAGSTDAITSSPVSWMSALQWESALPWLVGFWLLGVALIATRSFLHWRRLARLVRNALPLPRDWQLRLIQMRQQFGVLRPVRLLSSIHVATPTLIGWLKPAILLPASLLSGFTPTQIELIVAHELSHVRRFDYIANLAQVAIETLLFYHPVVYWISRDVRQSRESCCDDLVLTLGGGDALAYARTLADLEEMHHDFGAAVPALGVGGGMLLARIRRIVDPAYASALDPLPRGNGITLPVLLACAGLGVALLRMHLIPATLVAALTPTLEWSPARSLSIVIPSSALTVPLASAIAPVPRAERIEAAPSILPVAATDLQRPALAQPAVVELPITLRDRVEQVAPLVVATAPVAAAAPARDATPAIAAPPAHVASVGPEPSEIVQARYPIDALRSGITGKVDLDFRIAADGSVRDVRIIRAQPTGVFEQAAVAALRQWHFDVSLKPDLGRRYGRSFAFAKADSSQETCHEVTGSHICRHRADAPGG